MMALAESTRSVANGSALLQRALATSPVPDPLIVERLEVIARRRLGSDMPGPQRFEDAEDETGPAAEEGVTEDDVLAEVLADLSIGNALLAAGQALGEGGVARDDQALGEAVTTLNKVADSLDDRARPEAHSQGFEPVEPSADLTQAAERLTQQLDATLEELAEASAGVVTEAMTAVLARAPGKLSELIDQLGSKLDFGQNAQRLTKLGLATIDKALTVLTRLFPINLLREAKEEMRTLAARLQAGEPAPAVLGWLIGVEDVRKYALQLPHPQARLERLDLAVGALRGLGERYSSLMKIASGIVTAIGSVSVLVSFLGFGVPHLALVTAGAFLLVAAAVLLLGLDYTDARPIPGFVPGVRVVVRDAWVPA